MKNLVKKLTKTQKEWLFDNFSTIGTPRDEKHIEMFACWCVECYPTETFEMLKENKIKQLKKGRKKQQ